MLLSNPLPCGRLVQLLSTAEEVAKLQEELEMMRPQLEDAVHESVVTMEQISKDTVRTSD